MARTKRRKKSKRRRNRRWGQRGAAASGQAASQKMSEVLLDFIAPYRESAETDEEMERLLVAGIAAWNLALLPEAAREAAIADVARRSLLGGSVIRRLASRLRSAVLGPSVDLVEFRQLLGALVARKLGYFAENRRFILDYELSETDAETRLFVVSIQESSPESRDELELP